MGLSSEFFNFGCWDPIKQRFQYFGLLRKLKLCFISHSLNSLINKLSEISFRTLVVTFFIFFCLWFFCSILEGVKRTYFPGFDQKNLRK